MTRWCIEQRQAREYADSEKKAKKLSEHADSMQNLLQPSGHNQAVVNAAHDEGPPATHLGCFEDSCKCFELQVDTNCKHQEAQTRGITAGCEPSKRSRLDPASHYHNRCWRQGKATTAEWMRRTVRFAYRARSALATTAYGKKSLLLDNTVRKPLLMPCCTKQGCVRPSVPAGVV